MEEAKTIALETDRKMKMVAFYGKGGIGKSTTASNVSAALSHMGQRVLQVGCDPKHDSISTLVGGKLMPTILALHEGMTVATRSGFRVTQEMIDSVIFTGYNGVLGCESGGPRPARGCAGKGVNLALELLMEHRVPERYGATFLLFDVLGDAVCGGFTTPMRSGFAKETYLVGCGEMLTLHQVNQLARAVRKLNEGGAEVAVAGIINNMRGIPREPEIVEEYARRIGVPVTIHIPRSKTVQLAEFQGKTVIEAYPDSEQAEVYRTLARKLLENDKTYIPNPIGLREIKEIVRSFVGKVV